MPAHSQGVKKPRPLGYTKKSLADVSSRAWFRWAGDSAALLGVRVEAPRDMGFLRGCSDEKNWVSIGERSEQARKWRIYRRDVLRVARFLCMMRTRLLLRIVHWDMDFPDSARVEGEISVDLQIS